MSIPARGVNHGGLWGKGKGGKKNTGEEIDFFGEG